MRFIKIILKKTVNSIVSFLFPFIQSDKIVVCGGWFGKRFADNSKAMFLFLNENKDILNLEHVVYIAKNRIIYNELLKKGYDVEYYNSLKGIIYQLRAKYHFVDQSSRDINSICSVNAVRINLWHGFPLKKIGYLTKADNLELNNVINQSKENIQFGKWHEFYNLVLSEKHSELQQYAFGLESNRMIIGSYPRTLYMLGQIKREVFDDDVKILKCLKELVKKQKKIIGYFPTFRDNVEQNLKCIEIISHLNEYAKTNNCIILTKLHFAVNLDFNFSELSNTINLNNESDVYDYLRYLDVMISDYSSISFDYLLFNRPLIYYAFDLEYYMNSDRGFLFNYEDMCVGEIVKDEDTLYRYLNDAIYNENEYVSRFSNKYKQVKNIVYENSNPTLNDLFCLWDKISKLK